MAGFGDILKLMSNAKQLQEGAESLKNDLPKMEFTSTAANGGVSVTAVCVHTGECAIGGMPYHLWGEFVSVYG